MSIHVHVTLLRYAGPSGRSCLIVDAAARPDLSLSLSQQTKLVHYHFYHFYHFHTTATSQPHVLTYEPAKQQCCLPALEYDKRHKHT